MEEDEGELVAPNLTGQICGQLCDDKPNQTLKVEADTN